LKISRNYLKIFSLLFAFSLVFGVISNSLVSYANVSDLMIGTGSNALMTMELDDSDYSVMPLSSVGTVTNTISPDRVWLGVQYKKADGSYINVYPSLTFQNNRFSWSFTIPEEDLYISRFWVGVDDSSLPPNGYYNMSFDYSSHISHEYNSIHVVGSKLTDNAQTVSFDKAVEATVESGDVYLSPMPFKLYSFNELAIRFLVYGTSTKTIGGSFALNFKPIEQTDDAFQIGIDTSERDYQNDVSSSLSDLSSSVGEMSDEISGVTEAIQNLQGAMEPHYSNVLTQLHHITEQLHAFYDQVYNNIHLPELNMLTQIKTAIENIDLQIEVDISEVKTAINNMSTAVQNKLQSTTDQITGGYDNSGIVSDQTELDSALNEYQQAEDELFEDAKEHINNFEFDTPLDAYVKPLEDISYFLTGIYNGLGGLNIPIQFSLTLTIALILIGYYRIKR